MVINNADLVSADHILHLFKLPVMITHVHVDGIHVGDNQSPLSAQAMEKWNESKVWSRDQ